MKSVDVMILGAGGYGGGELLRLLSIHPYVRSIRATSRSRAGTPVVAHHPHLRGVLDITFEGQPDWSFWAADNPVVFSSMPSFELAKQYPALQREWRDAGLVERLTLIDLSGDFRLGSDEEFEAHYKAPHPCPEALTDFVYGLPEAYHEAIKTAKRIANPGCYATSIDLGLLPLAGLKTLGRVCISAMTGSSGSGVKPKPTTHHPYRAHDVRAYKPLEHQHLGEIKQLLAAQGTDVDIALVPHSLPVARGIFSTLQFDLQALGISGDDFYHRYESFCARHAFVDLVDGSPRLAAVVGTNRCELAVHVKDSHVVVLSAVDNLGKGMAGQAVQNLNIIGGWPEKTGLNLPATYP